MGAVRTRYLAPTIPICTLHWTLTYLGTSMYIGPHTCMSGYVSAYHGVGKLCILLHTILCHAVLVPCAQQYCSEVMGGTMCSESNHLSPNDFFSLLAYGILRIFKIYTAYCLMNHHHPCMQNAIPPKGKFSYSVQI